MPKFLNNCRICNSTNLVDTIDLGEMHLTGVFVNKDQPLPIKSPLSLLFCNECKYLQIDKSVNPNLMYKEYWYRSGANNTMQSHLKGIYDEIINKINLDNDSFILDIGCNDGTLLSNYNSKNLFGFDPSNAILEINNPDITKINDYFSIKKINNLNLKNKFKVITSISMFYDVENPNSFVNDVYEVLDENGIWVVEMNYTKNIIKKLGFDMISHEHVGYYTIISFQNLVNNHNLYINDIFFNEMNGGSVRFFCSKNNNSNKKILDLINDEKLIGLDKPKVYKDLMKEINALKNKINSFLSQEVSNGKKIALYGASTRNETVLQYCNIDENLLYAASERNPDKIGLYTAGSRIPIKSEDEIRKDNPEYLFIGPYYFVDEFIDRERQYLLSGGKFILPLPQPMIIENLNGKIHKQLI